MIRHIVMFKLKDFNIESEKMAAAALVKKRLDELPSMINVIRHYEAGIDIRRLNWSYDIVLTMDFDTMADLEMYIIHPEHKKFIEFNKDYTAEKVCIDYEI